MDFSTGTHPRQGQSVLNGRSHHPFSPPSSRPCLCLNDQGGGVMHIMYDVAPTLRQQMKHHEPIVLVYESHGQDARYRPLGEICETVSAKYGLGGGNVPIVVMRDETGAGQR